MERSTKSVASSISFTRDYPSQTLPSVWACFSVALTSGLRYEDILVHGPAAIKRARIDAMIADCAGTVAEVLGFPWPPDDRFAGQSGAVVTLPDTSRPELFAALEEQLGLRLVAGKGSVDVLVIEHIEKPTEN